MSGGHFEIKHYRLTDLAEAIHDLILDNDHKHYDAYKEEIIDKFREFERLLDKAAQMLRLTDYLVGGDIGENTLIEEWPEDV